MVRSKAGRVSATAVIACTICAGVAAGATNDAEFGVVKTFTVNPSQVKGAVTLCPDGTRALSGGIVQSGSATEASLRESGPVSDPDDEYGAETGERPIGWVASISGAASPATFKVFVVCARANVTLAVRHFTGTTFREHREEVKCPGSRRAVGGGALQQGAPGFDYVTESAPIVSGEGFSAIRSGSVPTGWRATFAAQESRDEFKVVAVCTKRTDATMKVATEHPPEEGLSQNEARCNGAQRALGGGVLHKGPTSPFNVIAATGPLDESMTATQTALGDVPKYWYAAMNFLGNASAYKTIAICE